MLSDTIRAQAAQSLIQAEAWSESPWSSSRKPGGHHPGRRLRDPGAGEHSKVARGSRDHRQTRSGLPPRRCSNPRRSTEPDFGRAARLLMIEDGAKVP